MIQSLAVLKEAGPTISVGILTADLSSLGSEVSLMEPDQITAMTDETHLLVDQQDVTPMGLAYQAIELQTGDDPLDAALRRVLRAMKV